MKAKKIHNAFHASLLKPFFEDAFERYDEPPPPVQIYDGEKEYEAEKILARRKFRGQKWKGYESYENTWQTRKDLKNASEKLAMLKASTRTSI